MVNNTVCILIFSTNAITSLVLHFNISITQRDKKYLFPIYYACKYGHKDVVKFLISAGKSPYFLMFHDIDLCHYKAEQI